MKTRMYRVELNEFEIRLILERMEEYKHYDAVCVINKLNKVLDDYDNIQKTIDDAMQQVLTSHAGTK
jgi:hypothetical protein